MISVVVIAKNEQEMIGNCLESVKWADEIVVALNDSTDETEKIASKYTKNIIKIPGQNFAKVRNEAFKKTTGDWVFYVDADERVTKSLKDEILNLINNSSKSAFAISRRNIILGHEEKYKAFWPDYVTRLLKRDNFETYVGDVHEYPKFKGELGYTKNSFIHLTHRNLDQIVLKSLEWSNIDAKLRMESKHPKMTAWRFIRLLITELYNQLFTRGGMSGGTIGVIDSLLQTFSFILSYIRLWELQQNPSLSEKYQNLDQKLLEREFDY